jgi:uncharacterized protein (DUF1800 family)
MMTTGRFVAALVLTWAVSAQAVEEKARAALLLSRATYGARPGELEHVVRLGVDRWLDTQLHPERIDDRMLESKLEHFTLLDGSTSDLMAAYPRPSAEERRALQEQRESMEDGDGRPRRRDPGMGPGRVLMELSQAKLLRAVYSERQLQEVMTDFWFNHFNVYARKNRNTLLTMPAYERDAIRPHVLGKFEDLLLATARHPAMLFYLDNWVNTKEGFDPWSMVRGRPAGRESRLLGINENYARELMELHTLGVDSGYTQNDVVAVARAFTGWSVVGRRLVEARARMESRFPTRQLPKFLTGLPEEGSFYFNAPAHDEEPKTILGVRFDAGSMEDGRLVAHMLATHAATARFISFKLAQRFVSDSPSDELVGEMTRTFQSSGGDIREVLSVLFRSERFLLEGRRADKVRTPLELVVGSVRATSAKVEGPGLVRALFDLGMPLYLCQPPTGYDEEASVWLTAGSVLTRIRFAGELAAGRIRGVGPLVAPSDIAEWMASVVPSGGHSITVDEAKALEEAMGAFATGASVETKRMALVLASPAFQRQ